MNQKVQIGGQGGVITLTDKHYKAAGGEASLYVQGDVAFKIYHDAKKAIPEQKIQELSKISNPHVITPQRVLFDTSGTPIGFTTQFVDDAEPIVKLFTRTFKDQNGVDPKMVAELVKFMQLVTNDVHGASCLVVDYNELNILVKITKGLMPYYIDVDSYSTPSFKATAIMDSVRDRRVSSTKNGQLHYDPDLYSDWFSWGILAFWLYTNIHPFRGNHANYRPKEKGKQMDDGISVFHKGVRMPPTVNDFAVIPKRHLDWFKDTFGANNRSVPPLPDSVAPIAVPKAAVTVQGNASIDVTQVASYPETISDVFSFFGVLYAVGQTTFYAGGQKTFPLESNKRGAVCTALNGSPVAAKFSSNISITFFDMFKGTPVGTVSGTGMFARNNAIYAVGNGKMTENTFLHLGNKLIHQQKAIENVSLTTSTVYDGCVIQDLLGKKYLTIPYAKGRSFSKYIPQLENYRVIEAKSDKWVTVVLAEKSGTYYRFVIVFTKDWSQFDVRIVKDVAYDTINFAVNDAGICLLLASPTELELFVNNQAAQIINDPPFDASMKLFTTPDGFFFINNNSLHKISKK